MINSGCVASYCTFAAKLFYHCTGWTIFCVVNTITCFRNFLYISVIKNIDLTFELFFRKIYRFYKKYFFNALFCSQKPALNLKIKQFDW